MTAAAGPGRQDEALDAGGRSGATEAGGAIDVGGVPALLARAQGLAASGDLLVASDFDGTLAHLHSDPWGARIIPSAQRALRRLSVTPGVHVALMSARSVIDLAERTRVGGVTYLGDHGAEWAEAPRGFRLRALRVQREAAGAAEEAMARSLARRVPVIVAQPWLVVEVKGSALTLHFRTAPHLEAARAIVSEAVEQVDPQGVMARSWSRRAIELRPPGASHKGDALLRLIEARRPVSVLMLGDDPADALAFDVLRSARVRGTVDGLGIAVGGRPDVSVEVARRADVALPGPSYVARFLTGLVRALGASRDGDGPRPGDTLHRSARPGRGDGLAPDDALTPGTALTPDGPLAPGDALADDGSSTRPRP